MFNFFLMWITTSVLSALLGPKNKVSAPSPSALGEFTLPTAESGRPIPVVYGQCLVTAPNVVWFGDLKTNAIVQKVKKNMFQSSKQTVGYRYFMGAQLVFCHGVDASQLDSSALVGYTGIQELRIGDYRFSAVKANADRFDPAILIPNVSGFAVDNTFVSDGNSYSKTHTGTVEYGTVRISVRDDELFGGDQKEGGFSGDIDFHFGQMDAQPSDYLQAVFGQPDIPAYRGYIYAVMRQCYVGTTNYVKPVSAVLRVAPPMFGTIGVDANPIGILADIMLSKNYSGTRYKREDLNLAGFQQVANDLVAEDFGLSMQFDTQSVAMDCVADVLRHIDAVLYPDPVTHQLNVKLIRGDYDFDELPVYDESNVDDLRFTRSSWADTSNVVKVTYINRDNDFQRDVVELKNTANISTRGGVVSAQSYDFLGLTNVRDATRVAERLLRSISTPLARATLRVNRSHVLQLHLGAVFKLNWASLGISDMAMRVTSLRLGDLSEPTIEVDVIEDVFGTLESNITPHDGSSGWVDPITGIVPASVAERAIEAPYHLLGAEDQNVMTVLTPGSGLVTGYDITQSGVFTDDCTAVTPSGVLLDAYLVGDLVDAVGVRLTTPAQLTAVQDSLRDAVARGQQYLIQIDDELMLITGVESASGGIRVTGVARGVLDTVPEDHAVGARVWFLSAGAGLAQETPIPGPATTLAMRPFTARGKFDGAITDHLVTFTGRARKPYAPGRLRVNALLDPAATTGNVLFSWANWPRKQMLADQRILDRDQDVYAAPDAGCTYTVEVLVGGVVVRTVPGLISNAYTYLYNDRETDDPDLSKTVVLRLTANESGFDSTPVSTAPFLMAP